jgi:hypothetical protein|nr:MAG TPA: hypothetical protein [Caudoviricetes sp.]
MAYIACESAKKEVLPLTKICPKSKQEVGAILTVLEVIAAVGTVLSAGISIASFIIYLLERNKK